METISPAGGWLIQTKFHPPLGRSDLLPRRRLLDALAAAVLTVPLTLISAPAGYGKTTLAAMWLRENEGVGNREWGIGDTEHEAGNRDVHHGDTETRREIGDGGRGTGDGRRATGGESRNANVASPSPYSLLPIPSSPVTRHPSLGTRIAWLALDEDDNDVTRFLGGLIAALGRVASASGAGATHLLAGLENPAAQARRIVGVLINDLVAALSGPTVLVLDDLQAITEPQVYMLLDLLLERMPPQLHLLVTTRQDPPLALARLRGRGQLAEFRLTALRFSADETAAFFNERLGLDLAAESLTALQARTEGWPVGLRLLAGSLDATSSAAGRAALLSELEQSERFVFDFLADEVLRRQEPRIARFLIETSILSELTPALAQAVTGDAAAGALLEELERRGLFLESVAGAPRTYRYHALFAQFLRRQLERELPERRTELYARAARAEANPARAIEYLLGGALWEQAAAQIEQVGEALLRRGWQETLRTWIGELPPSLRAERPWLLFLLALCYWQLEDRRRVGELLQQALVGFEEQGDATGEGAALAYLASNAAISNDMDAAHELIGRALERPLAPPRRAQLLLESAFIAVYKRQDAARAIVEVEEALRLSEEQDSEPLLTALLAHYHPLLMHLPGGYDRLEAICRRVAARLGDQQAPAQAVLAAHRGNVHLWRGRLEAAVQAGEQALEHARRFGGEPHINSTVWSVLTLAEGACGNLARAEQHLADFSRSFEAVQSESKEPVWLLYLMTRNLWLQGRLDEARRVYERLCAKERPGEVLSAPTIRALLAGLLEIGSDRYPAAEEALRRAVKLQEQVRYSAIHGSPNMALAHLYVVWNRPDQALAELEPLLIACREQNSAGLILREGAPALALLRLAVARGVQPDYAARLLEMRGVPAIAQRAPALAAAPTGGELLSSRELEVLQLIAAGASNAEIGARLVISEPTVKTHVRHIFHKLDAANRIQAIARAREMGIM